MVSVLLLNSSHMEPSYDNHNVIPIGLVLNNSSLEEFINVIP